MTDIRQLRGTPHPPPLPRTELTTDQQIHISAAHIAATAIGARDSYDPGDAAVLELRDAITQLAAGIEPYLRDGVQVVTRDLDELATETAARDPEFRAGLRDESLTRLADALAARGVLVNGDPVDAAIAYMDRVHGRYLSEVDRRAEAERRAGVAGETREVS